MKKNIKLDSILLQKKNSIILNSLKKGVNSNNKIDLFINKKLENIVRFYLEKEFFNSYDNNKFLIKLENKFKSFLIFKIKEEIINQNIKKHDKISKYTLNIFDNIINYIYRVSNTNNINIIKSSFNDLISFVFNDVKLIKTILKNLLNNISFINNIETKFEEILKLKLMKNFPIIQLIFINRYSEILYICKIFQKPIKLLKRNKGLFKNVDLFDEEKIKIYLLLSELSFYIGNYIKALSYCKRGLENSWSFNVKKTELKSYKLFSKVYYHLNNWEASEYYNNKYIFGEIEEKTSKIKKIGLNCLRNRNNKFKLFLENFNYHLNDENDNLSLTSSDGEDLDNCYLNLRNNKPEFKKKFFRNKYIDIRKNKKLYLQHLSNNRSMINMIGKDHSLNNYNYYKITNFIKIDKNKIFKIRKIINKLLYYLDILEFINDKLMHININ